MTRPPWLETQRRSFRLSRVAIRRLEGAATCAGVGVSTALDAFLREALPYDPVDAAVVISGRLDADMRERARWEDLSDDVSST